MPPREPLEIRFWRFVIKRGPDDCWEWSGSRDKKGYGIIWIGYKLTADRTNTRSHRISWILANGTIPAGMYVCHKCDNPPCCNPGHLFIGTQTDNMADMRAKGRSATGDRNGSRTKPENLVRGEKHPQSKLTNAQINEIRIRYKSGLANQYDLAKEYNVCQPTISAIVAGKYWNTRQESA